MVFIRFLIEVEAYCEAGTAGAGARKSHVRAKVSAWTRDRNSSGDIHDEFRTFDNPDKV